MTQLPNWFDVTARPAFQYFFGDGRRPMFALQLGAFAGDASVWLMTHTRCRLVDVDTWEGSAEHEGYDFAEVERTYDARTSAFRDRIEKVRTTTTDYLCQAARAGQSFDFAYIDAAHDAPSVLADAVGAWRLLTPGGLLAFDDYLWVSPSGRELDTPAPAIDAFRAVHADQALMMHREAQVWLCKRGGEA